MYSSNTPATCTWPHIIGPLQLQKLFKQNIGAWVEFNVDTLAPNTEPLSVPWSIHKSYAPDLYNTFSYSSSGIPYFSGIHNTLKPLTSSNCIFSMILRSIVGSWR